MNKLPRQRVLDALAHKPTDRVPVDFWATPEVWEKLHRHFGTSEDEAVLQTLGIDIRRFQPPYVGPQRRLPDGSWFDALGVHRRQVKNAFNTYDEYASAPLAHAETADDLADYAHWPSPDNFDFSALPGLIGDAHETYYIKLETGGLFELAWALRGYGQFFMDMVLAPDIVHGIMGRLCDFYCEYVRRAMAAAGEKYDMVYTYDDIAAQSAPLMSKDMWRALIRPYHVKLNEVIHACGKKVMYHSCGAVYDMIPELAALPIDVLNPIQPGAAGMEFERIKENFGDTLCFHGGICIQNVLPHGTPADVRAAVDHACATLGRGGGYILTSAHYLQNDTPVENILEMYRAAGSFA